MSIRSYGHYEHFYRYFQMTQKCHIYITSNLLLTVLKLKSSSFFSKYYTFDPDGWVWLVCWPIVTWVTNGPCVRPVILLILEPKMLTPLFPWVWWFDGPMLWTRGRVGKPFTPPLLPLRLFCWSMSCVCEVRMWWLLPFTLTTWVLLLELYFELVEDWYGCW